MNSYDNVSISGEMHNLGKGSEYSVLAYEERNKYGYGYKIQNIRRDKPTNPETTKVFLLEILTENQANNLIAVYPNIVDKVIKNDIDDIDLSKIYGVAEKMFDKIRKKIIENFALIDLVDKYNGIFSLANMRKLYEHYPSVVQLEKKLKEDPYGSLTVCAGIGFIKADELILKIDKNNMIDFGFDVLKSQQRCKACMTFALRQNESDGHTRMGLKSLKSKIDKLVPECSRYFATILKEDEDFYADKKSMSMAVKSTYDTEWIISEKLKYGLGCENVYNIDVEKYKKINDEISLTDEQSKILDYGCSSNALVLNGFAGCVDADTEYFNGKSWVKISDYKDGDDVLQYNRDGTTTLLKPQNYIKKECDYLWHFKTKYGIDQCLSDEHNVYYITSKGNLYNKSFKEVRENHENNGFLGKFITTFEFNNNNTFDYTDEEIRLFVAIKADSSVYYNSYIKKNKCVFNLKKQRKKDRLEYLLKLNNIEYNRKESTNGYTKFTFYYENLSKHYGSEWYNTSEHQRKVIFDEVFNWDGDYKKQNRFSTTNKEDADFIQFVGSTLGLRGSINTQDRTGGDYETCGKTYQRKSIEYDVSFTKRTLVGLCTDKREDHTKTPIEPYKTKDGFKYCFTVDSGMLVLRRNDKIFITGNSGKSSSTRALINMLKDNNKDFIILSPSAKAAKVISRYTGEKASTIHRGLGYNPKDNSWKYNDLNQLDTDFVIVDESGMIDVFIFRRLIDSIDFNKTKLLLIGDTAQLTSVGCGNCFHDIINSGIFPVITLSKIFRYGEGGISTVSTNTRMQKKYLSDKKDMQIFGKNKDYVFINAHKMKIITKLKQLYKKLLNNGVSSSDIVVLTAQKQGEYGTFELNKILQKIANDTNSKEGCKYGDTTYYEGDVILQCKNDYEVQPLDGGDKVLVPNGEIGLVKESTKDHLRIQFDNIETIYNKDKLTNTMLAYCLTTHKMQGDQAKIIILITPSSHSYSLNSNLIYVGQTRATKQVYHIGSRAVVNSQIMKKADLSRKTFLKNLLKSS